MATRCDCCNCHLEDDYGTSLAFGDGTEGDPFRVQQVDPGFIRPMVRVNNTAAGQALSAGVPATLTFTAEEFDSAGMWDVGSPARITFPIDTGFYIVGIQANFNAVA